MTNSENNKHLNVLIDISVLGECHENNNKAGHYRLGHELINSLSVHPKVNLLFYTSIGNNNACKEYLNSNTKLKNKKLRSGFMDGIFESLVFYLLTINSIFSQSTKNRLVKFVKTLQAGFHFLFSSIAPLKGVDIYYSLLHSVPKNVLVSNHVKSFQVLHDLTAVLFENFAHKSITKKHQDIINKIDPKTFVQSISFNTKKDLLSYRTNIKSDNIFVTHLGASGLFFKTKDNNSNNIFIRNFIKSDNPKYVLSLSTLELRKNLENIINGFLKLIEEQQINDLYLVLAGAKGWQCETLLKNPAINPSNIDKIIFTGYVDDLNLASLYSDAIMFLYMSHYEGFALPPLEAMQCGLPVITSNTTSLPEVVGDAGILIKPDIAADLSEIMLKLYNNPKLRDEYSQKSLQRAKQFSWEKCADELVEQFIKRG